MVFVLTFEYPVQVADVSLVQSLGMPHAVLFWNFQKMQLWQLEQLFLVQQPEKCRITQMNTLKLKETIPDHNNAHGFDVVHTLRCPVVIHYFRKTN
jgi:hypothetical protein